MDWTHPELWFTFTWYNRTQDEGKSYKRKETATTASLSTVSWPWSHTPPMWSVAVSTNFANYGVSGVCWQLMLGAHSQLPLWPIEWTTATRCCMARVYCSHTPATDGTECRRSYGRWYRQIRTHHTGASWHSSLAASHCEDTVQDCCFDLW